VNFGPLFSGAQIFDSGYLAHFLSEGDEIWQGYGLANVHMFLEFGERWSQVP